MLNVTLALTAFTACILESLSKYVFGPTAFRHGDKLSILHLSQALEAALPLFPLSSRHSHYLTLVYNQLHFLGRWQAPFTTTILSVIYNRLTMDGIYMGQ